MKLVDLNVLLYAVNRDTPHHESVLAWWEKNLQGDEPVGLAWGVLLGFLRLATNGHVFAEPLSCEAAVAHVDRWLDHPGARLVQETDEHWRVLRSLLDEAGTAGNLTTDAHLATLAVTHGATLVTCDADFSRFRSLQCENPMRRER